MKISLNSLKNIPKEWRFMSFIYRKVYEEFGKNIGLNEEKWMINCCICGINLNLFFKLVTGSFCSVNRKCLTWFLCIGYEFFWFEILEFHFWKICYAVCKCSTMQLYQSVRYRPEYSMEIWFWLSAG